MSKGKSREDHAMPVKMMMSASEMKKMPMDKMGTHKEMPKGMPPKGMQPKK